MRWTAGSTASLRAATSESLAPPGLAIRPEQLNSIPPSRWQQAAADGTFPYVDALHVLGEAIFQKYDTEPRRFVGSGRMREVVICHCGAAYERTETRLIFWVMDDFCCDECGEVLESWNGSRVPVYAPIQGWSGSQKRLEPVAEQRNSSPH